MFAIVSANLIFVTLSETLEPTDFKLSINLETSLETYSFNLPVLLILLIYSLNNPFCSVVRFLYLLLNDSTNNL
jgi:hypothetical protein